MTDCFLAVAPAEQEGQTADSRSTSQAVAGWQGGHPGEMVRQVERGLPHTLRA